MSRKTLVTRIRLAFLHWAKEHKDYQEILPELERKFGTGYSIKTIASNLPITEKTILNHDGDTASDEKHVVSLLKKVSSIISKYTGCPVIFEHPEDPDTYLSDLDQFTNLTRQTARVTHYPDTHYFFHYLKSNNVHTTENLLLDFANMKVVLYPDDDPVGKRIEGTILTFQSIYLLSFVDTSRTPYWSISFNKSDSSKDFYIAPYHKISKERSQPAIGEAVIVKANSIGNSAAQVHSLASFLIHHRRLQLDHTKFFLREVLSNTVDIDKSSQFSAYHFIQRFVGTWEGYFINPFRKRFENCAIRIESDGRVTIWIHADLSSRYEGCCTKLNDLFIIRYDYQKIIRDYRASMVFSSTSYNGELHRPGNENDEFSTLYGVLGCIERDKNQPVATRVAMRKKTVEPLDLASSGIKLAETQLEKTQDVNKFRVRIQELDLEAFFYGEDKVQYSSLALLKSIEMRQNR